MCMFSCSLIFFSVYSPSKLIIIAHDVYDKSYVFGMLYGDGDGGGCGS